MSARPISQAPHRSRPQRHLFCDFGTPDGCRPEAFQDRDIPNAPAGVISATASACPATGRVDAALPTHIFETVVKVRQYASSANLLCQPQDRRDACRALGRVERWSSQPLDDMYALCPSWRLRSITTSPELAKPKEIGRRLSDQALSSALNGVRRRRRHVVVRRGIRDGSDVPAKCISGRRSRPTSRPVRQRRYLTHRRQSPNRTMIRSASLPG